MATLVRALLERGHRVSVITLSTELSERRILKGANLTYYVYPMRTQKRMRDLFKVEREGLREGICLAKPDIVHAHWSYEFALACLELSFPTLITNHDNALHVLRFNRDLYRLGRLYLQIRVIKKARFLTAVSPYLADSLRWISKTDIHVIPNPVNLVKPTEITIRSEPGSLKIATVLNGWGRLKNPKAAINAFNLFRRYLPNAEMFMYGNDYEEGGPACRWASSHGLQKNIRFSGFLPPRDLHNKLTEMSMLLHPALEESFGMAIVEALAIGLPVIAGSDSGAVPWILDNGEAGFLTNVRKPKSIVETLLTCLSDDEARKRKQVNGLERLRRSFSPGAVAEQYETMYERVLSFNQTDKGVYQNGF